MPSRRAALPYPEPVTRTSGPWRAVLEQRAPAFDPERLLDARNLYPEFLREGGAWRVRPALERKTPAGAPLAGSVRALAALSANGLYLYAVAGTKFYRYQLVVGGPWEELALTGGVSLGTAGTAAHLVPFFDKLIVAGSWRPWQYDPATGAMTLLTDQTTAFYTRPVVYAGKLFGINTAGGAPTAELVWSEEADALAGYVPTGNRWTLGQTSAQALLALAATNQSLFYFRGTSIGRITGAVTPDFQTTSTLDDMSTDVGIGVAASILVTGDGDVWFVDKAGIQRRITVGGVLEAPGAANAISAQTNPPTSLFTGAAAACEAPRVVLSAPRATGALRVYDTDSGAYYGQWALGSGAGAAGTNVTALALAPFPSSRSEVWVGTDDGHTYRLRAEADGTLADDTAATSATDTVRAWLEPAPVGFLAHREATWDRLTLSAPEPAGAVATPPPIQVEAGPSGRAWPAAAWGAAPAAPDGQGYARTAEMTLPERRELALDVRHTRYLRLRLYNRAAAGGALAAARFAVDSLTAEGTAVGGDPDAT